MNNHRATRSLPLLAGSLIAVLGLGCGADGGLRGKSPDIAGPRFTTVTNETGKLTVSVTGGNTYVTYGLGAPGNGESLLYVRTALSLEYRFWERFLTSVSVAGQSQVKARCGTLDVPEDPANPSGRQISLNIAVVKAISRTPAPDPIFLLAGGPGQAATQAFLLTIFPIDRLRFDRDIVMVDQRGTGKSNPLVCRERM